MAENTRIPSEAEPIPDETGETWGDQLPELENFPEYTTVAEKVRFQQYGATITGAIKAS